MRRPLAVRDAAARTTDVLGAVQIWPRMKTFNGIDTVGTSGLSLRIGGGRLVELPDGQLFLRGGGSEDFLNAREFVSLFLPHKVIAGWEREQPSTPAPQSIEARPARRCGRRWPSFSRPGFWRVGCVEAV